MNNIEEEFFKTFGIDKQRRLWTPKEGFKNYYPPITNRTLLELICLHSTWSAPRLCATNIEALKRQVLRDLICEDCDKLREQVRKLF